MLSDPPNKRDEKGPLPLVLAVTGHRDLRGEDHKPLKQQVRTIFHTLEKDYPFTPFQLMSALAEGADRLVASVALEFNIPVVACLPMEKSLYECDFKTNESRDEFKALLQNASRIVTLSLVQGETLVEHAKAQDHKRNLQYQNLAVYLVTQCQILIALWDGVDSGLVGGTSSVVHMQLSGDIDSNHPIDFPETGPVLHVVTPRIGNPEPVGKPYSLCERGCPNHSQKAVENSYANIYRRMDAFNRDALTNGKTLKADCEKNKDHLFQREVRIELGDSMVSMIDYYALTDTLAIYYRTLTQRSLRAIIFGSGILAVFLFECFADGPEPLQVWALLCYVILCAVTYGSYKLVNPERFKTKYLDYRALAEGLRLQIFWRIAGLKQQVADYYLRKQKTELGWIRNAIRVWSAAATTTPRENERLDIVQSRWIEDQFRFFERVSERDQRRQKIEKCCTFYILLLTMAIASATLLIGGFGRRFNLALSSHPWQYGLPDRYKMELHGLILIGMAILWATAGAITAYSLKMAVGEQEKQYRRMQSLFRRGSECLKKALATNDRELAIKTIFDLGKEALEENGDWVLLHRERNVDVHLGG